VIVVLDAECEPVNDVSSIQMIDGVSAVEIMQESKQTDAGEYKVKIPVGWTHKTVRLSIVSPTLQWKSDSIRLAPEVTFSGIPNRAYALKEYEVEVRGVTPFEVKRVYFGSENVNGRIVKNEEVMAVASLSTDGNKIQFKFKSSFSSRKLVYLCIATDAGLQTSASFRLMVRNSTSTSDQNNIGRRATTFLEGRVFSELQATCPALHDKLSTEWYNLVDNALKELEEKRARKRQRK
jgi:hypothetical protein